MVSSTRVVAVFFKAYVNMKVFVAWVDFSAGTEFAHITQI